MADQDIDMIGTHALQYGLEETGGDWCTGSGEVKVVLMTIYSLQCLHACNQ